MQRNLGILIFDEVEVLDFCGPLEVFGSANDASDDDPFRLILVAEEMRLIHARKNLEVMPTHSFGDCPELDILLVPGGIGTRKAMYNERIISWIRVVFERLEYLLSVCTGSLVLGQTGLLDGLKATTHHTCFTEFEDSAPKVIVERGKRWVDTGKIVTSAGISAGMDMSLYMVEKLLGPDITRGAIEEMEYNGYTLD